MMHMSYWFGIMCDNLLFEGFTITTTPGFIGTCLGLLSISVLYEGIRIHLMRMKQKHKHALNSGHCTSRTCSGEEESLLTTEKDVTHQKKWLVLLIETAVYIVQIVVGYLIMLCVMTYNGYFTIAVVVGSCLGHTLFAPVLFDIAMNGEGSLGPKRECQACLETAARKEEEKVLEPGPFPPLEEGMVHCAVPPPEEEHLEGCHKLVAEVHGANV